MGNMTFEQFVEKEYPGTLKQYERYINNPDGPQKGNVVRSVVSGFGGDVGQILRVVGKGGDPGFEKYGESFILLQGRDNEIYVVWDSIWWKKIEVI